MRDHLPPINIAAADPHSVVEKLAKIAELGAFNVVHHRQSNEWRHHGKAALHAALAASRSWSSLGRARGQKKDRGPNLSHPLIFSRAKMQLEVGILMRRVSYDEVLKCKFGSRNRRERGRATTNAGP